jgi:hypothetical protein
MPDTRITRHQRGVAQDFANQLAQMAVGVEAMFMGSALKHEPLVGVIEIDAANGTALVNGGAVKLALASYLNSWVIAELGRKKLDSDWLTSASVRVQYSRQDRKDGADFIATARVMSRFGETSGSFTNSQPLISA